MTITSCIQRRIFARSLVGVEVCSVVLMVNLMAWGETQSNTQDPENDEGDNDDVGEIFGVNFHRLNPSVTAILWGLAATKLFM